MAELKDLIGKTMVNVENVNDDEIVFTTDNGRRYKLYHSQDCCESVSVESIVGDLTDLVGAPILLADEVSYSAEEDLPVEERVRLQMERANKTDYYYDDSQTWTFYKFATIKGYVDIRWFGTSNGYYSESVDFAEA
jgi:hypothetical protein